MTTSEITTARFDFGRVFRQTFTVIGAKLPILLLLGFVLLWPAAIANGIAVARIYSRHLGYFEQLGAIQVLALGVTLFSALANTIAAPVVTDALNISSPMRGRPLQALARYGLPAIIVQVIVQLATALGTLALFVPGLLVMVIWYTAIPSLIFDGTGIGGALNRARVLSRGHRWSIFGITFLLGLISLAPYVMLLPLTGGLHPSGPSADLLIAGRSAVVGLTGCIHMVAVTVVYWELRRLKEGGLADVFD
ncbi:MAG TPA: hypothetical protein VG407_00525 [Caulobacteraceae bacterium]|jgi:hypothetical protein|nr:hypothetical protein [Caulobacteraceae bacterium]